MLDVFSEDLIDPPTACREKPLRNKAGKPCHVSQFYRYALRGARAANGERVKLETVRVPGGLRTSREAIARFIESLTNPDTPAALPRTATRKKEMESAEAELQAAGFEM